MNRREQLEKQARIFFVDKIDDLVRLGRERQWSQSVLQNAIDRLIGLPQEMWPLAVDYSLFLALEPDGTLQVVDLSFYPEMGWTFTYWQYNTDETEQDIGEWWDYEAPEGTRYRRLSDEENASFYREVDMPDSFFDVDDKDWFS